MKPYAVIHIHLPPTIKRKIEILEPSNFVEIGKFAFFTYFEGTVWRFQEFYITEILREINFVASRSGKTAIFAQFYGP